MRSIVEAATEAPPKNYESLLTDKPGNPITDEIIRDVAEFCQSIKGTVTTEDVLKAVDEERPA